MRGAAVVSGCATSSATPTDGADGEMRAHERLLPVPAVFRDEVDVVERPAPGEPLIEHQRRGVEIDLRGRALSA
jgi:hypothetical protein